MEWVRQCIGITPLYNEGYQFRQANNHDSSKMFADVPSTTKTEQERYVSYPAARKHAIYQVLEFPSFSRTDRTLKQEHGADILKR